MSRELLAVATPRPWRTWTDPIYGNCQSWQGDDEDAALIVAAVNEYEALLDIADALRRYLDGHPQTEWDLVKDALARLDAGRAES